VCVCVECGVSHARMHEGAARVWGSYVTVENVTASCYAWGYKVAYTSLHAYALYTHTYVRTYTETHTCVRVLRARTRTHTNMQNTNAQRDRQTKWCRSRAPLIWDSYLCTCIHMLCTKLRMDIYMYV